MGQLSAESQAGWERFGRFWLSRLVIILLRCVHDAALAYDLATETLAAAKTEWAEPPEGEDGAVALLELAATALNDAATRERVSAVERGRHGQRAHRLTVYEQRAIQRLAEGQPDLSRAVAEAAEHLARVAPSPHVLRQIRLSGLIEAEPIPDHDRSGHAG